MNIDKQISDTVKNLDIKVYVQKAKIKTKSTLPSFDVDIVAKRYRNFLVLVASGVIPAHDIDAVWHEHILDTRAYASMCKELFGFFLHHIPFVGQDESSRPDDIKATSDAYEQLFSEPYFGSRAAGLCCPKGRDCQGEYERGPSSLLKTIQSEASQAC